MLLAVGAATEAALAGPQTYATTTQTIHAGVVILDSAPQSAGPFALYNYDANLSVKPVGWTLQNPNAPSVVTSAIHSRWAASVVGDRVAKKNAAYWEVFLDGLSDAQLVNYDVLLVNPALIPALNSGEREKLRRFVDHGGLLWIDPSAGGSPATVDASNNFPTPFGLQSDGVLGTELSDYTHPLLSRPFALTPRDVDLLDGGFNTSLAYDIIPPAGLASSFFPTQNADYLKLRSVSQFNGNNVMDVEQIGSGFVVVTSRGASVKLNRVAASGASYVNNGGYVGLPPTLEVDGLASAKLFTNMISLLSEYRQQGADARKSGGSLIDLGGPLLKRVVNNTVSFPAGSTFGSVIYRGMVIVSNGDHLEAYNGSSATNFNGDGNTDASGFGTDMLWRTAPGLMVAPISAPVVAEVPEANLVNGLSTDMVLVVDGTGKLHAFNPVARAADGSLDRSNRIEITNTAGTVRFPVACPSGSAPVGGGTPNPPTVFEGMAYIADTVSQNGGATEGGRVWIVDLKNAAIMKSANEWFLGGTGPGGLTSTYSAPPFAGGAIAGYIPILDNSGGTDRVLYIPTNGDGGSNSPGFVSLWLGSRGEKPVQFEASGNTPGSTLSITTRASQQSGLPIYITSANPNPEGSLGFNLTITDANGNPLPASTVAGFFTDGPVDAGGGVINYTLSANGATYFSNNTPGLRIDYSIDWGSAGGAISGILNSIERGRLQMPDQPGSATRKLSPGSGLALSPAGTVFIAEGVGSNSALFGFQEQGRGNFVCNFHYELYPQYSFETQGSGTDTELPVVADNDSIASIMAPSVLFKEMTSFTIIGSPATRNGQVYITVNAMKGAIPLTLLMAFQSEPSSPQFQLDSLPDGSTIVQADLIRSTGLGQIPAIADVPSVIPTSNYVYDTDTQVLRIDNLMNTPRGQIQQCLSESQRLWVRRPGSPDLAIDPDNQGGASRWSPLLWYTVLNGYTPSTGPLVTGSTVYFGGQTALPSVLSGQTPSFVAALYAFSSQIAPNDSAFVKTINIPNTPVVQLSATDSSFNRWNKQLLQLPTDTSGNFVPNPDVRWPQLTGTTSLSDYVTRLNQTLVKGSSIVTGIAGGDGILVAQGDAGLETFERGDFVVADQGRIATFDPDGNVLWSASSYQATGAGDSGGAATIHPLVRPTRAYRVSPSDFLVVDSGGNTVVRMDQAGNEIRALTGFILDPNHTPVGFASNEGLSLKNPGDALTFGSVEVISSTSPVTVGDNEAAGGYEFWQHFVVADSGNHRLIELVDRYTYNPTTQNIGTSITIGGVPQLGVLYWHSPPVVSSKSYNYNSITRAVVPTGNFDANNNPITRYVYVAGVSSVLPTQVGTGTQLPGPTTPLDSTGGGGGIVIFDPAQPSPVVFNQITLPAVQANQLWVENPLSGNGSFSSAATNGSTHTLTNVSAVTCFVTGGAAAPAIQIMISDGTGVYEVTYTPNVSGPPPNVLPVGWMLSNQIYRVMQRDVNNNPLPTNAEGLQAAYARRLSADEVVVVNGYFGVTRGNQPFNGEVVQLDASTFNLNSLNFGFGSGSITFKLSSVQGTRNILLPTFGDRR